MPLARTMHCMVSRVHYTFGISLVEGKEIVSSDGAITSFSLKLIAIAGMTCNHMAWIFADQLPFPLLCVLEGAGGLTFPIMAFLLTEGWKHTSNIAKYEIRLAVFAVISQIPYSMFLGMQCNVLITLLLGLFLLHLHDVLKNRILWGIAVAAGILVSSICDWGIIGIAMILIAAFMSTQRQRALCPAILPMLGFGIPALLEMISGSTSALPALLYALGNGIAGLLLCTYRGKRGRPLKWFFYAYYPAHIAVLGIAHGVITGIWITG